MKPSERLRKRLFQEVGPLDYATVRLRGHAHRAGYYAPGKQILVKHLTTSQSGWAGPSISTIIDCPYDTPDDEIVAMVKSDIAAQRAA